MFAEILEKGNLYALLVQIWIGAATMENNIEVPQKIKSRTTIWSSNFTAGSLSEGNRTTILKRYLHSQVHCSLIHNSQDMKTTLVTIDRWMDKENVVYI